MSSPNPILVEILEALDPEKPREVVVQFRKIQWTFRTAIPNRLEDWSNKKISASVLGTASAYTASRVPEMAAATVAINGKDLRTIFAEELQKSLEGTIKFVQDRKDIQDDQKADLIDDLVTQTALDFLFSWMESNFTGDMVRELHELYLKEVVAPVEKKKADFFDSSAGTPPTPPMAPTT